MYVGAALAALAVFLFVAPFKGAMRGNAGPALLVPGLLLAAAGLRYLVNPAKLNPAESWFWWLAVGGLIAMLGWLMGLAVALLRRRRAETPRM